MKQLKTISKNAVKLFFLIILLSFSNVSKAETDVSFSNSTAYTWNIEVLDAFGNVIYSVNPTPFSSSGIVCLISATPVSVRFNQGGCSYTIGVNASSSCGTCGVCPAFSGVTFTTTYSPTGGSFPCASGVRAGVLTMSF